MCLSWNDICPLASGKTVRSTGFHCLAISALIVKMAMPQPGKYLAYSACRCIPYIYLGLLLKFPNLKKKRNAPDNNWF